MPIKASCPICGWQGDEFLEQAGRLARCPRCNSLERHRAIRRLFDRLNIDTHGKCLEVGADPSQCFARYFQHYECENESIEQADLPPTSYDLVLCIDVLEHCKDEQTVLQKVRGLLRWHGVAIFHAPCEMENTIEYEEVDEIGHWRWYSEDGFQAVLEAGGFFVHKFRDLEDSSPIFVGMLAKWP